MDDLQSTFWPKAKHISLLVLALMTLSSSYSIAIWRRRYLQLHRIMGRVYIACVAIAAPAAVAIAWILGPPILMSASVVQALGWSVTTATALYCIRNGRVEQHREWMLRGSPFAMVFVVARVVIAIPAIDRPGEVGLASVVWSASLRIQAIPALAPLTPPRA